MQIFKHLIAILFCCIAYCATAQPLPALIPYRNGDKWGYCDSNKKVLLAPQWASADFFKNGQAKVGNWDDGYSVIDSLGRYVIPPAVHWTGDTVNTLTNATLNAHDSAGLWGIVSTKGVVLIPLLYKKNNPNSPYYDSRSRFVKAPEWSKNWLMVSRNGKVGVVGEHNETLISFEYDTIFFPRETSSYFVVVKNGMQGITDTNNNIIVDCNYTSVKYNRTLHTYKLNFDYFIVENKVDTVTYTGVVNRHNELIVPVRYYNVAYQDGGGFVAQRKDTLGWYGLSGKQLFEAPYKNITFNGDSTITVTIDANGKNKYKQGLLGPNGQWILKPKYDYVTAYPDKIYAGNVSQHNHFTIRRRLTINRYTHKIRKGWIVIKKWRYVQQQPIEQPWSCGHGSRGWGNFFDNNPFMKKTAGNVYSFKKDTVAYRISGYVMAKTNSARFNQPLYYIAQSKDSTYVVVDTNFNYLIPPQKKYALQSGDFSENAFVFSKNGMWGVVDSCLDICIAPQGLEIRNAVRWKNSYYAITKPAENRGIAGVILDCKGEELSNFMGRLIIDYVTKDGQHTDDGTTYFHLTDPQTGYQGYVNVGNEIMLPKLSFKYKSIYSTAKGLFVVADNSYDGKLVDSQNNEIFKGINAKIPQYTPYTGLLRQTYGKNGTSFFYVNTNGLVYADNIGQ